MHEERGYSDDRKAARDALLVLLGAGVLVAAAPAKRRKSLGLLAILAVLALFLWQRALAATESTQVAAPEWERETETEASEVLEPQAEPTQAEEAGADPIAAEAAIEEPAVDEEAVEQPAAEETATEEVAGEAEVAPAEHAPEFEALDAALAALIGELERVEASRLEEVRIEEAQRARREAQAEDAREQQEAEAREREEESALVHAGRQLVHAGGSDGGHDTGDHEADSHVAGEGFQLLDEEPEAVESSEDEPQSDVAISYAEAWRQAQVLEPVVSTDELAPALVANVPVEDAAPPVVAVSPVVEAASVEEEAPVLEAAPREAAPAAGGLIGLIGRYSHHHERATAQHASVAHVAADSAPVAEPAVAIRPAEPATAIEPAEPTATERPARPAPDPDWL